MYTKITVICKKKLMKLIANLRCIHAFPAINVQMTRHNRTAAREF